MKYVGARYMPKFLGTYDNTTAYEALSVVDNGMGTSYVSNKPVPAGTPLIDNDYWAVYGMSNGAILNLQQQIDDMNDGTVPGSLQNQIDANTSDITSLASAITKTYNTVSDMIADTDLTANILVATRGYYNLGDGGNACYKIVSTTSRLHETLANGLYAELIYDNTVNVLQLGAHGDNSTDDFAIFATAVAAVKNVIVPSGRSYRLSDNLTLPMFCNLTGDVDNVAATTTILNFDTGGLIVSSNFVTVQNLAVNTDNASIALHCDGSGEYCHFKNLYLSGETGLKTTTGPWWMLRVEDVRCNGCNTSFDLTKCHPCATFINCYSNAAITNVMMIAGGSNITFIGCNFGFDGASKISLGGTSHVKFEGCNFEADHQTTGVMFTHTGQSVKFENCHFNLWGSAASSFLDCNSSVTMAMFEGCWVTTKTGHDASFQFLNANGIRCNRYGAIVYGKGCSNLPKPSGIANTLWPYFVDLESTNVMHFVGQNATVSMLQPGSLLYSDTLDELCYFNGTNVVKAKDGSVVV